MKTFVKKILKHHAVHRFLAWVGAVYIRFVLHTSTIHLNIPQESQPFFNGEQNALFLLWHNRIALITCSIPTNNSMHAMVSAHSDGRMIGDILAHFGVVPIHGSTSKGGATALKQLIRAFRVGHNVCITPDGPRGPAEYVSEGAAQLAMLADTPILCVSCSISRFKRLRSWDKLVVPLPFANIYFTSTSPFSYEADAQHDKATNRTLLRDEMQRKLEHISRSADMFVTSKKTV